MAAYNATLIQDVGELIAYVEQPLWVVLGKFHPNTYRSVQHVYEWMIRETIEEFYGLSVIGHDHRLDPYRQIRNKLDRSLNISLDKLIPAYVKAPRVYENPFVQVDLKERSDLYIQYYQHGTQSALKF